MHILYIQSAPLVSEMNCYALTLQADEAGTCTSTGIKDAVFDMRGAVLFCSDHVKSYLRLVIRPYAIAWNMAAISTAYSRGCSYFVQCR